MENIERNRIIYFHQYDQVYIYLINIVHIYYQTSQKYFMEYWLSDKQIVHKIK